MCPQVTRHVLRPSRITTGTLCNFGIHSGRALQHPEYTDSTCSCSRIPPNGLTSKAIFDVVRSRKRCRLINARVHRPCLIFSSPCRCNFISLAARCTPALILIPHDNASEPSPHHHPPWIQGPIPNFTEIHLLLLAAGLAPAIKNSDNGIWNHALSSPATSLAS